MNGFNPATIQNIGTIRIVGTAKMLSAQLERIAAMACIPPIREGGPWDGRKELREMKS